MRSSRGSDLATELTTLVQLHLVNEVRTLRKVVVLILFARNSEGKAMWPLAIRDITGADP